MSQKMVPMAATNIGTRTDKQNSIRQTATVLQSMHPDVYSMLIVK